MTGALRLVNFVFLLLRCDHHAAGNDSDASRLSPTIGDAVGDVADQCKDVHQRKAALSSAKVPLHRQSVCHTQCCNNIHHVHYLRSEVSVGVYSGVLLLLVQRGQDEEIKSPEREPRAPDQAIDLQ